MPHNVLLVYDHRLMRDGVKSILERHSEFQVIGESATGADAVEICRKERPELVLMDISLPDISGIEASREILRYSPQTRILMMSMHDDEHLILAAIRSGARAFLLQTASGSDLIEALRNVANGGSYLSPEVSDRLVSRIQTEDMRRRAGLPIDLLSPREVQVLRLVAQGKTSKDIAVILNLGLQTVRSYRKTLMKKLGVNNVAGVTQIAFSSGLMQPKATNANTMG